VLRSYGMKSISNKKEKSRPGMELYIFM